MIYRVVWEERYKLKCSCCEEQKHPWQEKQEGPFLAFSKAESFSRSVYPDDDSNRQVRNVSIQKASAPEWVEANPWEEPQE